MTIGLRIDIPKGKAFVCQLTADNSILFLPGADDTSVSVDVQIVDVDLKEALTGTAPRFRILERHTLSTQRRAGRRKLKVTYE